jgi:hypothetical protein
MLLLAPFVVVVVIAISLRGSREAAAAIIGFFVAALVPAGAFCLWPPFGAQNAAATAIWFAIGYLYSITFVVVLGVPAFFALRPFRPGHWWSVAAAGMLLGIAVSVILRLPQRAKSRRFHWDCAPWWSFRFGLLDDLETWNVCGNALVLMREVLRNTYTNSQLEVALERKMN